MNQCPKCELLLYRRTFAGVQIDGCPSCGGSWFDGGELKALVREVDELRRVDIEFRPGVQPASAKAAATCPKCGVPLTEMAHPSLPELRVDACRACRGIFLDHGEPTKVANARSPPEDSPPEPEPSGTASASSAGHAGGAAQERARAPYGTGVGGGGPGMTAAVVATHARDAASTPDYSMEPLLPEQASFEPASIDAPSPEDARLEMILRAVAIPAALLLAYLALHSDGLRMLGTTFMAMWVHELGHASTAWLFGHFAFPGPWITWSGESRNVLVILLVTCGILALGLHGARRRSVVVASIAAILLVTQIIATGLASRQTASAMITFFGDGGQLVIGMLLMLSVYSPRGSKLHQGWLRWGLLVIGAVAFADALHTWLPTLTDFGAIPFGMQSHAGLSDASRLVDNHGWDERALVMRHIRLAQTCGLALACAYAAGLYRSWREMKAVRGS